jgi:hypothetical protein
VQRAATVLGVCAIYRHFSRLERILLPNLVRARPPDTTPQKACGAYANRWAVDKDLILLQIPDLTYHIVLKFLEQGFMNRQVTSKVGPPTWTDFASRFESLPRWEILAIIAWAITIISLLYLWPSYTEFPMDDTYIHFVYARNLVERGSLIFNFAGERGVGTTSILWVLLLAVGMKLGLAINLLAKILGMLSLATVGMCLYLLLRSFWRVLPAFAGALLVAMSGNMIWFALSGMDTMLFLALGVLALLAYREERWGWLGISLGLLILTRPEGVALAIAIGLIELLRHRRITKGVVVSGLICIFLCGPWFGYLLWRTGHFLPTSGMGKQISNAIAMLYLEDQNGVARALGRIPGLIYIGAWVGYLMVFTLGGMALPEPHIAMGNIAGNTYTISLWSIPGWGVITSLLFVAARKLSAFRKWQYWIQDYARRPIVVLVAWTILHNLSYMVFLPMPGTASRYGAVNHIVLWLALVGGILGFAKRPRLQVGLSIGLIVIAVANTVYWNGVYDANLDHMMNVRIPAAQFIRDNFPADRVCAAYDVGVIRYYSQRPIIDLGGLIDPEFSQWYLKGSTDQYLVRKGVTCLVLPGRTGATDEGWYDFARMLGLTNSPFLRMNLVQVFEIDHERWLQGYLPTVNYQASVAVYRLVIASSSGK